MYKVNKIGLLNFWYYDEEEYDFYDGKLLLRGENASGKSVTMQSFIPLILDGNKSPKRLDTFGGSDKHIEYYLLGDDKESSTGYLYMEFFNNDDNRYITIGIGLSAKRGKPTDFYGFALKDGTRIHEGFELYKLKDGFNKTPLTKHELKASLGPNNEFVEKAKDYKKMVNNLLFGFKNIDSYDDFINIILQIRSPKLSKDYKPSILIETLNSVLPALNDEDLRPLSDTIESLNSTKEKMNDLNNKIKELTNFIKVYKNYNDTILYQKAKNYLDKKNEHDKLLKEENVITNKIKELEETKTKLKTELDELKNNYEKAKASKETINNQDVIEKTEKLAQLELDIKDLDNKTKNLETKLTENKEKLQELKSKKEEIENNIFEKKKSIALEVNNLEELASSISFDTFINYLTLLTKGNIEFSVLSDTLKKKQAEIKEIKQVLEEKTRLDETIEEKGKEEDNLEKEYQKLIKELEDLDQEVALLKEEFINTLLTNNKNNQELVLEEHELKEIINCLKEFNLDSVEKARSKYNDFAKIFHEEKLLEKSNLDAKRISLEENLDEEKKKLETLRNMEETELAESELESLSLNILESRSISYLPFYKAIDFKDNLSQETKNKLEANLLASGLLGSKIISKKSVDKLKDTNISYIIPSTKKKENLTKYLAVSPNLENFDQDYIKEILESISISSLDNVYINENSYHFDFLNGNMNQYESKFIGFLNRKKEHEKLLKEQEEVVLNITKKISSLNSLIDNLNKRITILQEESNLFPSSKNLENTSKRIEHLEINVDIVVKDKNKITEVLSSLNEKLQNILVNLNKLKGNSKIPLNLASYNNASSIIDVIEKDMYRLNGLIEKESFLQEQKLSNDNYLNDIETSYEELFDDISINKDKIKKMEAQKKAIEEVLNTKEYQELQTKLKEIENILNSFSSKNESLSRSIGSNEKELENYNAKLTEINSAIAISVIKLEIYYSILEEEFNLKYSLPDMELQKDNVKTILKSLESSEGRDKDTALANYYKGFNNYRQSLMEYALSDNVIFSENEANIELFKDKGLTKEELEDIYKERARRDITAIYQSKKVDLYKLLDSIKDDYEETKIYLSESDRHLFEDILLRTVGTKIKDKINNAKEWVANINNIMDEKQKNSNLSFHLVWQNLSPESLEEMDTKALVEIFKMDPDTLTKESIDKLIKHFRAKIAKAEETMNDNKESYFDVVFKILDYRNWFQFKLYYRRNNSDKKELTDKIFSVFSGGEKAKTMYVPLFASISAKLSSASLSAPRLIALDEAFAGVDDKNIEEMFAILKSFDLDYILTSQALWCDYSEVKDISICNLVSDHVSKTIGVDRYRWNGITRMPVPKED